jgi:hypothetical protein
MIHCSNRSSNCSKQCPTRSMDTTTTVAKTTRSCNGIRNTMIHNDNNNINHHNNNDTSCPRIDDHCSDNVDVDQALTDDSMFYEPIDNSTTMISSKTSYIDNSHDENSPHLHEHNDGDRIKKATISHNDNDECQNDDCKDNLSSYASKDIIDCYVDVATTINSSNNNNNNNKYIQEKYEKVPPQLSNVIQTVHNKSSSISLGSIIQNESMMLFSNDIHDNCNNNNRRINVTSTLAETSYRNDEEDHNNRLEDHNLHTKDMVVSQQNHHTIHHDDMMKKMMQIHESKPFYQEGPVSLSVLSLSCTHHQMDAVRICF